jgi:hypothetical protein
MVSKLSSLYSGVPVLLGNYNLVPLRLPRVLSSSVFSAPDCAAASLARTGLLLPPPHRAVVARAATTPAGRQLLLPCDHTFF